jgi:putative ATP-binding cassette transporter
MLYLPTGTPYLPRGSLKEVLAYPLETDRFPEEAFGRSLSRMGLDRLLPLLNETRRWDRELSQDEQLGLALARIVMQAPPWLLIDDMLGGLDDQAMERVVDIFSHELEHTSIIHIGRAAQARDPLFQRVLHLVPSPAALTAIPGGKAGK